MTRAFCNLTGRTRSIRRQTSRFLAQNAAPVNTNFGRIRFLWQMLPPQPSHPFAVFWLREQLCIFCYILYLSLSF